MTIVATGASDFCVGEPPTDPDFAGVLAGVTDFFAFFFRFGVRILTDGKLNFF